MPRTFADRLPTERSLYAVSSRPNHSPRNDSPTNQPTRDGWAIVPGFPSPPVLRSDRVRNAFSKCDSQPPAWLVDSACPPTTAQGRDGSSENLSEMERCRREFRVQRD